VAFRMVALALSLLMCSAWLNKAQAAEPVITPLLRVETGMHTTQIRRVLPDLPRNRLITCSSASGRCRRCG
jgi:hypothetical protein